MTNEVKDQTVWILAKVAWLEMIDNNELLTQVMGSETEVDIIDYLAALQDGYKLQCEQIERLKLENEELRQERRNDANRKTLAISTLVHIRDTDYTPLAMQMFVEYTIETLKSREKRGGETIPF